MGTSNALDIPSALLDLGKIRSQSLYCDVNPVPDAGTPDLLYDSAAVFASLRNLILSARGTRSRIFQEDYFSEVYDRLHEPFDEVTASSIRMSLFQAFSQWEPRVSWTPDNIRVYVDEMNAAYVIAVLIVVNGVTLQGNFALPALGA